ncbi:MAG TPA: hypothetical protein VM260_25130 [Pirellula sp.]|nr:hypothetical protein [Pirellula sp.]
MSRQMVNRGNASQQQKENRQPSELSRGREGTGEDFYDMVTDVSKSMSEYCAKRPQAAALALLAVGFFLGWKLKPW